MENNIAEVVAIRYLDFKDKDGEPIVGYQVFLALESGARGWCNGREIIKAWIPVGHELVTSGYIATLRPGSPVAFVWNRYGKAVIVNA